MLAMKWRKQLRLAMQEAFLTEDAELWDRRLNENGKPCAVQRSTAEWLSLPEVMQAGLVETSTIPFLDQSRHRLKASG